MQNIKFESRFASVVDDQTTVETKYSNQSVNSKHIYTATHLASK